MEIFNKAEDVVYRSTGWVLSGIGCFAAGILECAFAIYEHPLCAGLVVSATGVAVWVLL